MQKLMDEKGMVNTLEGNLSILDRETEKCISHLLEQESVSLTKIRLLL